MRRPLFLKETDCAASSINFTKIRLSFHVLTLRTDKELVPKTLDFQPFCGCKLQLDSIKLSCRLSYKCLEMIS